MEQIWLEDLATKNYAVFLNCFVKDKAIYSQTWWYIGTY